MSERNNPKNLPGDCLKFEYSDEILYNLEYLT